MWLEYQTRHLPAAAGMRLMVSGRQDLTPRDYYTLANNAPAWITPGGAPLLLRGSPFSPIGPALAIEFCGDDYKSHFREWEKAAAEYPGLAMAFARRAKAAAPLGRGREVAQARDRQRRFGRLQGTRQGV